MTTNPHGVAYYKGAPLKGVKITIIGVGAVGSWLAVSLAKQGAALTVVDFDTIEYRNLGAAAFYENDVGRRKADALDDILFLTGDVGGVEKVKTWRVTPTNLSSTFTSKTALVVDCTDNAETRNLIQTAPVPVLHVGINDHFGSAVWAEHFTGAVDPDDGDVCDAPYSLNLILPLVGLTVDMLCRYFTGTTKESFGFNLITGRKEVLATHKKT